MTRVARLHEGPADRTGGAFFLTAQDLGRDFGVLKRDVLLSREQLGPSFKTGS